MRARDVGAAVSHAAGVDTGYQAPTRLDPDEPVDAPHESHAWVLYDRWMECAACGARDHWPAAEVKCYGEPRSKVAVTLDDALTRLLADLIAFEEWWDAKNLGSSRPTYQEWTAEFLEWTRFKGGML